MQLNEYFWNTFLEALPINFHPLLIGSNYHMADS